MHLELVRNWVETIFVEINGLNIEFSFEDDRDFEKVADAMNRLTRLTFL